MYIYVSLSLSLSLLRRSFSHRIKGVSTSDFTPEEVKTILEGGNEVGPAKARTTILRTPYCFHYTCVHGQQEVFRVYACLNEQALVPGIYFRRRSPPPLSRQKHNALWMGAYNMQRDPAEPSTNDGQKTRADWLQKKYGARKWFLDPNAPKPAPAPAPAAAPAKMKVATPQGGRAAPGSKAAESAAAAKPAPAPAAGGFGDFDAFGSGSAPAPAAGDFGDFDAFGSGSGSAPAPTAQGGGFGDFGNFDGAPAAATPQGFSSGFDAFGLPPPEPPKQQQQQQQKQIQQQQQHQQQQHQQQHQQHQIQQQQQQQQQHQAQAPPGSAGGFTNFSRPPAQGGGALSAFDTPPKPADYSGGGGGFDMFGATPPQAGPAARAPPADDPFATFSPPAGVGPAQQQPPQHDFGAGNPLGPAPGQLPQQPQPQPLQQPAGRFGGPGGGIGGPVGLGGSGDKADLSDPFASISLDDASRPAGMAEAKFSKGDDVIYLDSSMNSWFATILSVHWDDPPEPFFTILVAASKAEKQVPQAKLNKMTDSFRMMAGRPAGQLPQQGQRQQQPPPQQQRSGGGVAGGDPFASVSPVRPAQPPQHQQHQHQQHQHQQFRPQQGGYPEQSNPFGARLGQPQQPPQQQIGQFGSGMPAPFVPPSGGGGFGGGFPQQQVGGFPQQQGGGFPQQQGGGFGPSSNPFGTASAPAPQPPAQLATRPPPPGGNPFDMF